MTSAQAKYLVEQVVVTITLTESCTQVCQFLFLWFVGPDPADKSRILIKKVFSTNKHTYFYEDVRLDVKNKTVHSKSHSLAYDFKEHLDQNEIAIRTQYRKNIHVLGFSLYWRPLESGKNHMSITEYNLYQPYSTWSKFFRTYFERRDAYKYIKSRWFAH